MNRGNVDRAVVYIIYKAEIHKLSRSYRANIFGKAKRLDEMKGKLIVYVVMCTIIKHLLLSYNIFLTRISTFSYHLIPNFLDYDFLDRQSSLLPIFTDRQLRDVIQSNHVDAGPKSRNQESWE